MAAIDEVLGKAQLSADERKLLDNVLSKNPDLRDGWERQGDYSRKTQALAAEKKKYDEALEYNERMKAWADEKVPLWDQAVEDGVFDDKGVPVWKQKQTEYERQIADLKAQTVGGEVDAEELSRRVKAIVKDAGALSKEEINGLVQVEAKKMADEMVTTRLNEMKTEFNTKTIPYLAGFGAQLASAVVKYEKETGKEWDDASEEEFAKFMNKEEDYKPRSAMEKFLGPIRKEKAAEADLEARAEKRAQELIKQRGGMPGAGGEPYIPQGDDAANSMGSLKKMLKASESEAMDVESAVAIAASKAAGELRTEGKSW